jgi:hypothetical protein
MKLSTNFSNEYFQVSVTSQTVIEPKQKEVFVITLVAQNTIQLFSIDFAVPEPAKLIIEDDFYEQFPQRLKAGSTVSWKFPLVAKEEEGFCVIEGKLGFAPEK